MPINKKRYRLFWWILGSLFIFYIGNYIALENGYYETKMRDKATLTSSQIKQFEKDVKEGKEIDLENYVLEEPIPNTNKYSKAGLTFSTTIEGIMTDGISTMIKFLGKLFGN